MSDDAADPARAAVDAVYRAESRRVLATLIRLLGDFDLAEEALHDAFAAAVEQWPRDGVPDESARLAGLDRPLQGDRRACAGARGSTPRSASSPTQLDADADDAGDADDEGVEDDRLRLIFTCCHPALPPDAQVALTLREVCGLTTEEIARAFLTAPPTRRPADRARQGEDPRRAHSLPGARRAPSCPSGSTRAARHLPRVQRGLLRVVGRRR